MKQPINRSGDFSARLIERDFSHALDAPCEFIRPRREILGDVVEDLRSIVRRIICPVLRLVRRFDSIAHILAIAIAYLPDNRARWRDDLTGVIAVRSRLCAADVELCRAIQPGCLRMESAQLGRRRWGMRPPIRGRLRQLRPRPPHPAGAQIGEQPLFAPFASIAAFAVAAKAGGRIEQIAAVDPHAARLDLPRPSPAPG